MPFPIAALAGLAIEAVPGIVRWIAGDDAGDVADKVSGIAKHVTGAATDEEAVAAIRANPELFAKFQSDLAALDADLEKAYLADRQDARKRDVAIQSLGSGNVRADILAIGALIGLVGLIWTLLFVSIPDGPARDVLLILSGALVAIVKDVYAFEFGSSRGSKEKSAALAGAIRRD